MTTLPQTTALRLPRPSNGAAIAPVGPMGPGAPYGAAAAGGINMTGGDVWRVIRTNMWLIIISLVVFGAAGFGLYRVLLKYYPSYTARGLIQIQPIAAFDLSKNVQPEMNQQMLAIEQRTNAQLLTHDALLGRLFSNPNKAIRDTSWFKQFEKEKNPIAAAKEDLKESLSVRPIPDSKLVEVAMSYRDGREAKIIVEDVVNEHLDAQRSVNMEKQLGKSQLYRLAQRKYERQLDDVLGQIRVRVSQLNIDGAGVPGRLQPREEEMRELLKTQFEMQTNAREAASQYKNVLEQQQNGIDPP